MPYHDFTEMPIWIKAMNIAVQVFELSSNLPRTEDYGLTSQIRRSAESISANIAEGFGKSNINDKVKYYEIAKGSAFETKSHLYYGQKVGYFNENTINLLLEELNATIFEINKLKKALKN
ncbi:four helix bundle protein [Empedobacter falsenii]|uniref:four helix bundle protein n=1 Tax=Empedobacter falsenii TaxID=343874 RepID=UPI0025766216|nr:four helix bundle protein [Empedobacter falsenii]MDM1299210.1 four helix bundle protein [Empedobacter falsenii]MDM1318855.1 four helix bundle protein [Empedobacter falsenii]